MKTKNLKPSEYLAAPFGKVFNLNFLIRNNLFFNEELFIAEDMLFNMRAVLKAKFVEYINGDIYEYRFNPNSVSNRFNEKIFENELKFNALIKQYLKQKDISQDLNTVYEKLSLGGILTIFNSYILPKRVSFSEKIKILKHLCESEEYKRVLLKANKYYEYFNKRDNLYLYLLMKEKYKLLMVISTLLKPIIMAKNITKNIIKKS